MCNHLYNRIIITTMMLSFISCKNFVQVDPPSSSVVAATAYNSNVNASAALNGIYITMRSNSIGGGDRGLSAILGLSADEFQLFSGARDIVFQGAYINSLQSKTTPLFWSDLYSCLYQANVALDNLSISSGVTPLMKQQLTGEAKFIRAFCFFYLSNIYGDIPLPTSSNYQINRLLFKTSLSTINQQIINDLKDAQNLLKEDFLTPDGSPTNERVRPNKGTASALLSRIYLFTGEYAKAEIESTKLIEDQSRYVLLSDLDKVFLANSRESIWQLQGANNGFNTNDGGTFVEQFLKGNSPDAFRPISLREKLFQSFESGDQRKRHWIGTLTKDNKTWYFPFKYKLNYTGASPAEYPTIFRLAEQYLIRAEVRIQQGRIKEGIDDLNVLRKRATDMSALPVNRLTQLSLNLNKEEALLAVDQERQLELFAEYGHRWIDLKRTQRVSEVMSIVTAEKGGVWSINSQLFPIPFSELQSNSNLKQNMGYN